MQSSRKTVRMKGKGNKLKDLPEGAKPKRTSQKKKSSMAIEQIIHLNQMDKQLNTEGANFMGITKKTVTDCALKSTVIEMPDLSCEEYNSVKEIYLDPFAYLMKNYKYANGETTDQEIINNILIAKLCIKAINGKINDVVGTWLNLNNPDLINTKSVETTKPKRENVMKKLIDRALQSDVCKLKKLSPGSYDGVKEIYENPVKTLKKVYPLIDDETASDRERNSLDIAILVIKAIHAGAPDLVGKWLEENEPKEVEVEKISTISETLDKLHEKGEQIKSLTKDKGSMFEARSEDLESNSRVTTGLIGSVVGSVIAGGIKMALEDDFSKTQILKTVAGTIVSSVATAVAIKALDEKDLSTVACAGIGGGIGLVLGGGFNYGLDFFSSDKVSESTTELPAPAEM